MIKYFTIEDLLKHYLQKKFHILEYWQHEFEVYKINLPIEKYLNSVKQDYLNNAATIYSESEHETEHLNSCNEYLQNLQSDLAEKEDYEIME